MVVDRVGLVARGEGFREPWQLLGFSWGTVSDSGLPIHVCSGGLPRNIIRAVRDQSQSANVSPRKGGRPASLLGWLAASDRCFQRGQ